MENFHGYRGFGRLTFSRAGCIVGRHRIGGSLPRVDEFITTLQQMERTKDVSSMLKFFTDDAAMSSIALHKPMQGLDGVKKFWTDYLAIFRTVKSDFVHVHVSGDLAVLEWRSTGELPGGAVIDYQGVSVLEFAREKICRFRTYYDSAAFVPEGAKLLGRELAIG